MTRSWTELFASFAELVPGGVPVVLLLSVLATILVALLWYFWPRWLPPYKWMQRDRDRDRKSGRGSGRRRQRLRLGRLRWRWRRRKRVKGRVETDDEYGVDELPDLPAVELALTADQLAAAGRYKEAVRERLRAMVRDLIELGMLPQTPGWTVTELAVAAIATRPAMDEPMRAAVAIFSEIWYGLRPATADDDQAMRIHAAAVGQTARKPLPSTAALVEAG